MFCVSLMCNIKKRKKKKYCLSKVVGIHVAAISYWQSHKKAEICRANPVYALLRGPHSSVAGHVDNKKELYLQKQTKVAAFHLMCNHKQACPLERLGWLSGSWVWGSVSPWPRMNHKSLCSLYLPCQSGLFVLDDPNGWWWCGALKVVDCHRPKDCRIVVSTCQHSAVKKMSSPNRKRIAN